MAQASGPPHRGYEEDVKIPISDHTTSEARAHRARDFIEKFFMIARIGSKDAFPRVRSNTTIHSTDGKEYLAAFRGMEISDILQDDVGLRMIQGKTRSQLERFIEENYEAASFFIHNPGVLTCEVDIDDRRMFRALTRLLGTKPQTHMAESTLHRDYVCSRIVFYDASARGFRREVTCKWYHHRDLANPHPLTTIQERKRLVLTNWLARLHRPMPEDREDDVTLPPKMELERSNTYGAERLRTREMVHTRSISGLDEHKSHEKKVEASKNHPVAIERAKQQAIQEAEREETQRRLRQSERDRQRISQRESTPSSTSSRRARRKKKRSISNSRRKRSKSRVRTFGSIASISEAELFSSSLQSNSPGPEVGGWSTYDEDTAFSGSVETMTSPTALASTPSDPSSDRSSKKGGGKRVTFAETTIESDPFPSAIPPLEMLREQTITPIRKDSRVLFGELSSSRLKKFRTSVSISQWEAGDEKFFVAEYPEAVRGRPRGDTDLTQGSMNSLSEELDLTDIAGGPRESEYSFRSVSSRSPLSLSKLNSFTSDSDHTIDDPIILRQLSPTTHLEHVFRQLDESAWVSLRSEEDSIYQVCTDGNGEWWTEKVNREEYAESWDSDSDDDYSYPTPTTMSVPSSERASTDPASPTDRI